MTVDERLEVEDRLREYAPADDMWGPIRVERVPATVRRRYLTGGAPTSLAAERPSTNATQDADTSRAA